MLWIYQTNAPEAGHDRIAILQARPVHTILMATSSFVTKTAFDLLS